MLLFANTGPTGCAPTQLHGIDVHTWMIDDRTQGALNDKGNITRTAYGASGPTTFLIRPDGYVGAIATTTDTDAVLNTFRRLPTRAAADRGVQARTTDSGGNASAAGGG